MRLSVFQVEGKIPHKIGLKTLGMILLEEHEVWDLVEVVEEKICKMFLDEKVFFFFFFFFFLLIISNSSSISVSPRQGQSGLHIWASGTSYREWPLILSRYTGYPSDEKP